jgi:hypothetical protein
MIFVTIRTTIPFDSLIKRAKPISYREQGAALAREILKDLSG